MTNIITIIIITFSISLFAKADESAKIEQFLASRPSYKKIDLPAYEKSTTQYNYNSFFCDSAYKSERENISVTVLVRNKEIIGYHIQVTLPDRKSSPLGSNDIEEAITKTYDLDDFDKARSGTVGVDNKVTHNWIYINKVKLKEAKIEEIRRLSEKLKP